MALSYNEVAARSLHRIAALSDALFAIAMTLIVLEIAIPDAGPVASEGDLANALLALTPRFVTYMLSFLTLGIFWSGQQTQLNHLARADRNLTWLHLAFLAAVAVMPFSTGLLAEFITFRVALLAYWANILVLGLLLYATWTYSIRAGLVKEDMPPEVSSAIKRRIVVAQSLYAVGAALCLISTLVSLAFIVLVQLNYAIAPRVRGLSRL